MPPVCFVMFQGSRTNAGLCWQEGGFLPRLREVGDVFVYQNKLYNIFHGLPGFSDFPSDTEFDPGLPVSGGTPSRRVRRRATAVPAPRARRRRLVRGRAPRLRLRAALFSEKLWCSSIRRWCRLQGCVLACSSTGASSALASSLKRTLAGMLGRMRKRPCMKTAMLLLTLGLMRVTQMGRRKIWPRPLCARRSASFNLVSTEDGDPDMTTSLKVEEIAYLKKYPEYHYVLYVDEAHDIYARPGPQRAILRCLRSVRS